MPRKPRVLVTSKVTALLSEETTKKSVKRHGVPTTVHMLTSVYRLACGHTTAREWSRSRTSVPVGNKLKCDVCSAAAETHPEAACG